MRVLAIGAHPDDIEIACSGTLAKCVKRGDTVIVCHVSSGNLGHVVIPPDELRVIRANEAKKAGALAGIEVICAGFDDLEIFDNNKEARDKLVDIIKYANPDFIITLFVYECEMQSDFVLKEHECYAWLAPAELKEEEWAPADADILASIKRVFGGIDE